MTPTIVTCTIGNPGVELLVQSARLYAPDAPLIVYSLTPSTFGQAYNEALAEAFETNDEVILANDDVVLTPTTMRLLMEDVRALQREVPRLGLVACMTDEGRHLQNIRYHHDQERVRHVGEVSPIFAWMSKAAFEEVQFPPLNWYSDDVLCWDLYTLGYSHFVSRAYVHHAGSQSVGTDYNKLYEASREWVCANRPEYAKVWYPPAN